MLPVSGAVGDDGAPARHFADPGLKLLAPDTQRTRYHHVALSPMLRVARVYKDRVGSLLHQPPCFVNADQLHSLFNHPGLSFQQSNVRIRARLSMSRPEAETTSGPQPPGRRSCPSRFIFEQSPARFQARAHRLKLMQAHDEGRAVVRRIVERVGRGVCSEGRHKQARRREYSMPAKGVRRGARDIDQYAPARRASAETYAADPLWAQARRTETVDGLRKYARPVGKERNRAADDRVSAREQKRARALSETIVKIAQLRVHDGELRPQLRCTPAPVGFGLRLLRLPQARLLAESLHFFLIATAQLFERRQPLLYTPALVSCLARLSGPARCFEVSVRDRAARARRRGL